MGWIQKDTGGSDFKPVPEGTHIATCYLLVDLGWQETKSYGLKEQILYGWELPNELMDDGRPMVISATYTQSMAEKSNQRKMLESWRGSKFSEEQAKAFDPRPLVGRACQVTVTHTKNGDKTYANVTTVTGLPKGMAPPPKHNEPVMYSVSEPSAADYQKLPEWIRKKCDGHKPPPAIDTGELPPVESYSDAPPF